MTDSQPSSTPQAPELPAGSATRATERPRGIRYNDRVLVAGETGSGKSVLINHVLETGYSCQKLLVDTKDEFSVPGVDPVRDVRAIDWTQPVIHYIDDRGDLREYNELFRVCLQRKTGREASGTYGLVVCVHELADLCGDSPGATPQYVSAYIRKGRAHGLGLLGGTIRPVCMPKAAMTEAQHVIAFVPGFDHDDQKIVARLMRMTVQQFDDAIAATEAASPTGEHSCLWYDQRARPTTVIRPPLPLEQVQRGAIRGLDPNRKTRPEPYTQSGGDQSAEPTPD